MSNKTTIQYMPSNGLFHRVEQNVPWGGTKCSMGWNKVFHGVEYLRTLCLLLLMLVLGGGNAWGQTYYVFKYNGHYVAHNGYTTNGSEICVENEFSITKCLWEYTAGDGHENQKYLRTYGADYWLYYLSNTSDPDQYIHTLALKSTAPQYGDNQDGWNRANTTDGIRRYLKTTSANSWPEHHVCYNDNDPDTPCWELVTTDVNTKKALGTELTKVETSYTNITSSIGSGNSVISAFGTYPYSLGAITINDLSYVSFTDGGTTRYWYDDREYNEAPEDWEIADVAELTKTWSLSGADGYATVDAATGEVTVSHLPHKDSKKIRLTCTISKDTHSYVVSKTITLKPRTIQPPTISMEGSTITITSTDSEVNYYYATDIYGEPFLDTPTTESTLYEEPFTIESNVVCVKAIAVEEDGPVSEVATFCILPFSSEKIDIGRGEEATVAPFVYSYDALLPENTKAYIVSRVFPLDCSAVLSEVKYIPKDVPVLLLDDRATPQTSDIGITLTPIDDFDELLVNTDEDPDNDINPISESVANSNRLKVSDGTVTVQNAQVYMYYYDEFVLTYAGTIRKGRFYIDNPNYQESTSETTPSGSNTLQLMIEEETTRIDDVRSKMTDVRGNWFTLDGRRLSDKPTRKGVYINKGHKIVVR